jgi:zinc transporter 9
VPFACQTLLLVGIQRSVRAPDKEHPYGYLNERYLWALVSGVGIFFVGCGVSVYHGVRRRHAVRFR